MSIEAVAWALRQKVADPIAKLILISLADHHNASTNACHPGKARLAEAAVCDGRTIIRKLKWLQAEGWIVVCPRFAGNGRQTSNGYELLMTRAEKGGCQTVTLPTNQGDTAVTPTRMTAAVTPILEQEEELKDADRLERARQLKRLAGQLRA